MPSARRRVAVYALLAALLGAMTGGHAQARSDAAASDRAGTAPAPVAAVDTGTREFVDPARSNWPGTGRRPLRTMLWFPAGAFKAPSSGGTGDVRAAIGEASLSESNGTYPLILVSHGSGSRAAHMEWLARALVASGAIVAAVDHNGSADEELHSRPTPSDHFGWERAIDLRVVLDRLLEDPTVGPAIDRDRIGAAGFSLGGTTVLWMAGARLDVDHLQRNAPPMPPAMAPAIERLLQLPERNDAAREAQARAERSHRDPRVRSVFALGPAMGFGFTAAGLRGIEIPVRILVGRDDPVTPPTGNARVFATGIAGAEYVELPGERGHFTPRTPEAMRAGELAEVAASAVEFFERTLAPRGTP
ncbi:hypothetical protein FZO89_03525 [Luteimonas viscosa]|uniref:PET hydrolase/cutinase-like domain-containing protein n=1 Tax=Luteimonas viscosa TaxID=1132694 RepID=A0A5D4XRQ7_9GAMM|nr:hypothetical protein [Luteimonas viscosa]TYT25410.1 hypothetical protein FZO89_03525 [Luteimonas viscosa]